MQVSHSSHIRREVSMLPSQLQKPVERALQRLPLTDDLPVTDSSVDEPCLARDLVRLLASSEFAGGVAARQFDWLAGALIEGAFDESFVAESIADGLTAPFIDEDTSEAHFKALLRQRRDRGLTHILWRSVAGLDDVRTSIRALSDLADVLIRASLEYAERALSRRFGQVRDSEGQPADLIVLAMGKLGGRELNFSSDIDLIFVHSGAGESDGVKRIMAEEYFTRFARRVVSLLDEVTADGFVYRVDTRLRPFGSSGPLVLSVAGLENYLLRHGRGWERYAYVKARPIVLNDQSSAVTELFENVIRPFVYRRYLDYGVFESLREMKAMIAAEVQKRELQDDIKLGAGGIREVEFIVQSLQLVRGGANAALRNTALYTALRQLVSDKRLERGVARELLDAYDFLRKVENAIQAIRDQQTHAVPTDTIDRARLQIALNFQDWAAFETDLRATRAAVQKHFASVALRQPEASENQDTNSEFAALWTSQAASDEWIPVLQRAGIASTARLADLLATYATSPKLSKLDSIARQRLKTFVPALLCALDNVENPLTVCERIFSILDQILRRSAYVALLNENPAALARLIWLCDRSAYLTGEIARYPILLDELLDPDLLSDVSRNSIRRDLNEWQELNAHAETEQAIEALAKFKRATLFRIAVADVSGQLPIMKVSDRLTELAEGIVRISLRLARQELEQRFGRAEFLDQENDGEKTPAGIGIVAYGKLGGLELAYGSDLDLVFLHDSRGRQQQTGGPKVVENSVFFARLAQRLVHFLTIQTPSGALYEVDTRLRPSGRAGLLVVSTEGFEKYQQANAWTWEHQALLRSRVIAGSDAIAADFMQIRAATLTGDVRRDRLLEDVLNMREKMRTQLDRSNSDMFDLKQGEGGIGDIEFIVQYLVLKHAASNASLYEYTDNIRQLDALAAGGFLKADDAHFLQQTYQTYRQTLHHLNLDKRPPLIVADAFLELREEVSALWAAVMV